MIFQSNISVDPSELTKIVKVEPKKAFKRILYFLTRGLVSDKNEIETFTAISVLQQLYMVFHQQQIKNLVKLSHDDIDFYFDKEGKKNDLKETLDLYELQTNEAMSVNFKKLKMVLEHEDHVLKYLIHITINKNHDVGVYPIDIFIDAVSLTFTKPNQEEKEFKNKIKNIFESQAQFDAHIQELKSHFDTFTNHLAFEIKKQIQTDDLIVKNHNSFIIPKNKKDQLNPALMQPNPNVNAPIYHGYYGFSDALFYSVLWSDMMHHNHIHVHDSHLFTDHGDFLTSVDGQGVDSSDFSLFQFDEDLQSRIEGSDIFFNEDTQSYETQSNDSDSWWGGDWTDFGDSGSGSDASCSSCSSCSSCGGGSD